MKKVLLFVTALLLSFGMYAQNRFIIHHDNTTSGYIIDNVDSLTFANVEGEVAAYVEVLGLDFESEKLSVKVTRTAACESFKISVAPTMEIASMTDYELSQYIDRDTEAAYYQDFPQADLSGIDLLPNTEYTIATVGIDKYGVLCDVKAAAFSTPSGSVIGDPQVAVEVIDVNHFDFTVKFTPNEDVSKYYVMTETEKDLDYQFEFFGPMFGFSNYAQMIEAWGLEYEGENTYTWKDKAPGTKYDILVLAYDKAGTAVPYATSYLTTDTLGGKGNAEVSITTGEYKLGEWTDEEGKPVMLPSQFITFTPNDQASGYRFEVYTAEIYDIAKDTIKQELCSEPPMPMVNWYFYEELTTDFQINPNTECVVVAAAKNALGEWGEITETRFTTPANVTSKSTSKTIMKREFKAENKKGQFPVIKRQKLQLIQK